MTCPPGVDASGRLRAKARWSCLLLLLAVQFHPRSSFGLPKRLILALDGVAYRDMQALQQGVICTNRHGTLRYRQSFTNGYYPVSRLVSTFPSASDVAWTEILGNSPLPGYQRTYFSEQANRVVVRNGVMTSMEYERQMTWRVDNGFRRAMGYVFPNAAFKSDLHDLAESFFNTTSEADNYYALISSTDDAQHLSGDIFAMLSTLDAKLEELCARYRAREGRNLEILLLSDHANNHAGRGKRVAVRAFLKKAGYRISKSIVSPTDVVLPTAGLESWVGIHNSTVETERLVRQLVHLRGVDLVTAQAPGQANRFIVMNSQGERAMIEWRCGNDCYRYAPETGDPLGYLPVVAAFATQNRLDPDGFAPASAWMAATLTNRYPVALERIARAHTRGTLNPATILISLQNGYIHAGWFVRMASGLVSFGGTHGALDDLNSTGILLSNFAPTHNTTCRRVAALYAGFTGRREFRAQENGAEWLVAKALPVGSTPGEALECEGASPASDPAYLRIWTPKFGRLSRAVPVEVTLKIARPLANAHIRRGDPQPVAASEKHLTLQPITSFPGARSYERVYPLPPDLVLEPQKDYSISGRIAGTWPTAQIFKFTFRTDARGMPVPE